ncbi:histone-like nucleoid-structuring protein Lsr2 [Streptomyces sp. NPDC045369]|uniref:Lsr2 dimerization domain-containing protein n=1 Tax=Streptomyces sp. NPDC045369 TaxID=3155732 RepID=UPI0033E053B9
MAKQTRMVVDYTDDMTGLPLEASEVEEDFRFVIDGCPFSLDTHKNTTSEVREALAILVANAEPVISAAMRSLATKSGTAEKKKSRTSPARSRLLKKIRKWAWDNNMACEKSGRIPEDIVVSFRTSNPGVDMTPYDEK